MFVENTLNFAEIWKWSIIKFISSYDLLKLLVALMYIFFYCLRGGGGGGGSRKKQ